MLEVYLQEFYDLQTQIWVQVLTNGNTIIVMMILLFSWLYHLLFMAMSMGLYLQLLNSSKNWKVVKYILEVIQSYWEIQKVARADVRFLESDLNRMFLPNDKNTHEANRARELMPIFDTADLLIDFHQTILHTERAFYICPLTKQVHNWAKALQCTNAIVDATPKNIETATTRCADDYMYIQGKPALTINCQRRVSVTQLQK